MPIDLQGELNRRKSLTDQYLARQNAGIGGNIDARRAELEKFRGANFPQVGGALARYGASQTGAGSAAAQGVLAREAARRYNQGAFDTGRDLLNKRYQLAQSRQQQDQGGVNDANAFIRQFSGQDTQNRFAASETDKDRQAALEREKMADLYAQQGINLQTPPKMDYEAALMRSLFGLGAGAATAYALRDKKPNPGQLSTDPNSLSYQMQYGQQAQPTLRQQTAFTPRTY